MIKVENHRFAMAGNLEDVLAEYGTLTEVMMKQVAKDIGSELTEDIFKMLFDEAMKRSKCDDEPKKVERNEKMCAAEALDTFAAALTEIFLESIRK